MKNMIRQKSDRESFKTSIHIPVESYESEEQGIDRVYAELQANLALLFASVLDKKGIQKRQLAEELVMRPSTVSSIFNLSANPTLKTLAEWQYRLGQRLIVINPAPYDYFYRLCKKEEVSDTSTIQIGPESDVSLKFTYQAGRANQPGIEEQQQFGDTGQMVPPLVPIEE